MNNKRADQTVQDIATIGVILSRVVNNKRADQTVQDIATIDVILSRQ